MGFFDGIRANAAARRAYPALDLAINQYGDETGIIRDFRKYLAGVLQGVEQVIDKAAREVKPALTSTQCDAYRDICRAAILRESMEYLFQWRETAQRDSLIFDAWCLGLTGRRPLEFEPLQRLIDAHSKYPGIAEAGREVWQFAKDIATVRYGADGAVPSAIVAEMPYYKPLSLLTLEVLDRILHLSQGPHGVPIDAGTGNANDVSPEQ